MDVVVVVNYVNCICKHAWSVSMCVACICAFVCVSCLGWHRDGHVDSAWEHRVLRGTPAAAWHDVDPATWESRRSHCGSRAFCLCQHKGWIFGCLLCIKKFTRLVCHDIDIREPVLVTFGRIVKRESSNTLCFLTSYHLCSIFLSRPLV